MWRKYDVFGKLDKFCKDSYCHKMPQKSKHFKETIIKKEEHDPISQDKHNNIIIQILAKPGARNNGITGITEEGVGVQISAPPSDGEANTELVKYMSSVLGLRKNDVVFEKGFKSRSKTLKIVGKIAIEEVRKKINEEIGS